MPNHVINKVRFNCNQMDFLNILEFIRCKDEDSDTFLGTIDFNNIIPMPEGLDIEASLKGKRCYELYDEYVKKIAEIGREDADIYVYYVEKCGSEENLLLGKQYYENVQKYGTPTWYEWRNAHWGTKWNAYWCKNYEQDPEVNTEIEFYTAWSDVSGLIQKLSEMFEGVEIDYWWADENIGFNVGYKEYYSGDEILRDIPVGDSKEAYEMAAWLYDLDLYEEGYALSDDESAYKWTGINQYTGEEIG